MATTVAIDRRGPPHQIGPSTPKPARRRRDKGEQQRRSIPGTIEHAISLLPGGKAQFMEWVRWAGSLDDQMRAAWDVWDGLNDVQKRRMAPTPFFEKFGLLPPEAVSLAVKAGMEHNQAVAQVVAAISMPKVMAQNARQAARPSGIKDREMFMTATGMLPQKHGTVIQVQANAAALAKGGEASGLVALEDDTLSFTKALRIEVEED